MTTGATMNSTSVPSVIENKLRAFCFTHSICDISNLGSRVSPNSKFWFGRTTVNGT
jgi:hypothetical protein